MYSDAQYSLLRNGLLLFMNSETDKDGNNLGWKGVHEAIALYTGHLISDSPKLGAEAVRKFVKGEPRKFGPRHYSRPDWANFVEQLLTHDDVQILTSDEILLETRKSNAPVHLTDFLYSQVPDDELENISGTYSKSDDLGNEFLVTELQIDKLQKPYCFDVKLTQNFYFPDAAEKYSSWGFQEKLDERETYYIYTGWAVLTPEKTLTCFIKSGKGENLYLSSASPFLGDSAELSPKILFLEPKLIYKLYEDLELDSRESIFRKLTKTDDFSSLFELEKQTS